jgi:beta-phosphoglucomutase
MTSQLAVLFDMDGVIVDNYKYHIEAWKLFCHRYRVNITDEQIVSRFGNNNSDYLGFIFNQQLTADELYSLSEEKEEIYRELYALTIQPVKGLVDFLEMLKSKNIKTAVATSAPVSNLFFVLDKLRLHPYFDALVDGQSVKRGKPYPDIYLKAAEKLKVKPENCIVIEDSLFGIESGKRAGMKVIGLTTTHTADHLNGKADLVVKDFNPIQLEWMEAAICL